MELEYQSAFELDRYSLSPELATLVEQKVQSMLAFMNKMKGGVRTMRNILEFEGTQYTVLVRL